MRGRPKGRDKVDLHFSIDARIDAKVRELLPKDALTGKIQHGAYPRLVELLLVDYVAKNQAITDPQEFLDVLSHPE